MHWYLPTAAEGIIITSDNPLARQVDRDTCHPIYGDRGFLNPNAEITFPLSPTKLLLVIPLDVSQRCTTLTRDLVWRVNRARAAQSDQYLYASVKDPRIERLAAQFRDSRPTVTTNGLGPRKFARASIARRRTQLVPPATPKKKTP